MSIPYSSYGTLEQTLGHIDRLLLDTGETINARELRAYLIWLRQMNDEQTALLQRFADAARSFAHADDVAHGITRPQYDQARDKLSAAHDALETFRQRVARSQGV